MTDEAISFILIFILLKAIIMNYMPFEEGYHTYYIYIITNKVKTVLYTGVTNNLKIRLQHHSENFTLCKVIFASQYNVKFLLYFEKYI